MNVTSEVIGIHRNESADSRKPHHMSNLYWGDVSSVWTRRYLLLPLLTVRRLLGPCQSTDVDRTSEGQSQAASHERSEPSLVVVKPIEPQVYRTGAVRSYQTQRIYPGIAHEVIPLPPRFMALIFQPPGRASDLLEL